MLERVKDLPLEVPAKNPAAKISDRQIKAIADAITEVSNGIKSNPEAAPTTGISEDRIREIVVTIVQNHEIVRNHLTEKEVTGIAMEIAKNVAVDAAIEAIDKLAPTTIEIKTPIETKKVDGIVHKTLPLLIRVLTLRIHALLVGPAGSGKTTAAKQAAQALALKYFEQSCSPMMTEWDLVGYNNATGNYVRSAFREAYEFGGLFMLDEFDASNPGVAVKINSAIANGHCQFPDQMVARHPDFVLVAGANTFGTGADRVYVGRQQLDGATLDRFAVIDWDYDEAAEVQWAGNIEWTRYVQRIRKIIFDHKLRLIVSPRASIMGAKMLANGFDREFTEKALIWKGMDADSKSLIKSNL
jgi:hypothetical protein